MTRRRAGVVVLALLAFAVGAAVFVASQGDYAEASLPNGRPARDAPKWTSVCVGRRVFGNPLAARDCARVSGRVVWVQEEQEAGGTREKHLLLASQWRIRIVKVQDRAGLPEAPGLGSYITATGPLTRGSRGDMQVYAFRIE